MKFLVLFSLLAVAAAAESQAEEQPRDKRGVLGLGGYPALGLGYPGLGYHGLGYAAPVAKVIAPAYHAPIAKVIAPAYHAPIAKVAYPGVIPSYGLGYGYGHGLGYGLGYGHGLGYGLGYGYGGLLH